MTNLRREHPLFPKPLRMPAGLGLASLTAGALALAVVLALALDKRPDASSNATPAFLTQLLGPSAPTRAPRQGVSVRVRASGYTVKTATHEVAITSVGGGASAWRHFRGGATRTTRYGLETIAVGRDRTEEFLTVTSSRAPPTWRWRLDTNGIRPTLGHDGSVRLAGGLRVRPVEILDVAGRKVTPAGLRWTLDRKAGEWFLGLKLDDSKLPLPYVIDPAVDYPATQYLSSSVASAVLTSVVAHQLQTTAPSTLCTKVSGAGFDCAASTKWTNIPASLPRFYQQDPGTKDSIVNTTGPSTTPDGKGWIVDAGGTATPTDTVIPAGSWTFHPQTLASGASTGTINLAVGVWKVTVSGGAITASTNLLDPNAASATDTATNIVTTTVATPQVQVSLPEVSLTASDHILVQLYAKQTTNMGTQKSVGIVVGDGNSWISHPAATTRPSVPALQTPTAGLLLKKTTPTLSATFTDAGDTGQVNFRVCASADSTCTAPLQTFSSSAGNASGTAVAAQVPSALTDATSYNWQAQAQDSSGVTSAWSASRAFTVNTAGSSTDVTAPSTPTLALTENPVNANQFVSGTTLFYKSGAAGGSFDVTATGTTDAQSGVNYVTFPAVAGVTGGGNDSLTPYAATYTWNSGTSASGAQNVTATNNVNLASTAATFTLTPDGTGPSGGSVSYTNGFISTTSVTITTADGTDGGAGLDTATRLIERDSVALSNGVCGAFTGAWTTVTSPDTVTTGNCYMYRYTIADNVGNSTTYTSPNVVKVDTSAPNAPTLSLSESSPLSSVSGSTLFYNPQGSNSGSFTVTATASDAQSGIASVAFPVVFGADSAVDSVSPYSTSYSWIASSVASGAKTVNTTNNSSLTSANSSFTVTPDTAAPSGGSVTYTNGYNTTGSVTITTANGTDPVGGAGLDLTSALIERQTTSLGNGSCGSFTNPWTTVTSPDTVASGTCAKYRYTIADNVGNPVTYTSANVVKVDTSAPAAPPLTLSEVTGNQWEYVNGTTLYYNAQASNAGSFTVDAAASDAESGVTSATFPVVFGADGLTDATSPYQRTYSWTAAAVATGAKNVTALNNAGLTSSNSPFTVTKDIAAPSSGSITYANGYDTSGSIALTINEGTDALSGIDSASTLIERNSAPLTNGSCGSYLGWTTVSNPDTTVATGNCYQYRVTVKDNVGNTAAPYTSANVVKEDRTAPTGPALSLSESSALEFVSGATLFYNPQGSNSGSFTVTAATSDGESAVSSVAFPVVFGADSSSDSTSPYSATYSWTAAAGASGPNTVTATNGAALPSSDTFTVTPDTSAPSGGSVSYASGYAAGSVTVTTADGTDGGSGINAASRLLERDAVSLSNGVCGSFTGAWTTVTSPDSTVASGNCYLYRYTVADNVGNPVTYTSSNVVEVDTTAPNAPTLSFGSFTNASATGSTVYFRTGVAGGFTVTATASDLQSGIASRSFPALGTGWSGTPSGADDAYSFTSSAVDPVEPNNVTATNNAGLASANAPFTVTADGTAPATSITCNAVACSAGWYTASATVALSASDGGSGLSSIKYTTDGSDPSPVNGTTYSGSFALAATTTVKFRSYDAVGNEESVGSQLVRIDTVAPTGSLTAPAGGSALRGTVTVSSDSADGNSGVASAAFQRSPAGAGTWTTIGTANGSPYQASWDTTGVSDGSYDLRVVTTDVAGNPFTSATRTVTVDNTNPSGSLTDPGANLRGSVPLSSTGSDGSGSGVTSVVFQRSAAGANSWTTISTDSTSPYTAAWDTSGASDGLYDLRVLVTDLAGNSAAGAIVANRRVDNTSPSGSLTAPAAAAFVHGAAVTVSSDSTDSGSGVASVSFERSPAGANSWTAIGSDASAPYSLSWNTTALSDGSFDLRAVTTDVAGNAVTSGTVTVTVDNTNPTGSITAPAGGAIVTGSSVTVSSDSADVLSGVSSVAFQRSAAGANSWTTIASDPTAPYSVSLNSTAVADGNYDLRAVTTDAAGNSFTSAVVTVTVDNSAPAAPSLAFGTFTNASATGSTVYYRPGAAGGFTVTASASDSQSGISSYSFPALPLGWTPSGSGAARAYSYNGTPTEPGSGQSVTATNGAGLTSPASVFTVTADSTAPSTSMTCNGAACSAAWYTSSVTVALSAGDGGSGLSSIKYTTDGSDPSPVNGSTYVGSFVLAAGATVKFRAYDAVGNEESVGSNLVRIDTTVPSGSLTAPANAAAVRGSITVSSDSADGGSGVSSVAFQRSPAGAGTWQTIGTDITGPYSVGFDTTGVGDGGYDLRAVTSDVAGNSFTSPTRTITVDNTNPTGSLVSPGANLRASVTLSANASDATSGVASVVFQRSAAGANSWTTIASDSTSPYSVSWDTTAVTDGLYDLQVVVTDASGNSITSAVVTNRRVDNTVPAVSLTNPGATVRGTISLQSTSSDSGSGIASITYQRAAAGGSTWTTIGSSSSNPYSLSLDTTSITDGLYDLRAVAADAAGNQTTSSTVASVRIDNTAPSATMTDPGNMSGTVALQGTSTDSGSGVSSVVFQYSPTTQNIWTTVGTDTTSPYTVNWDTTAVNDGRYDLRIVSTDVAGNSTTSALVTNRKVANNPPIVTIITPGDYVNAAAPGSYTITVTTVSNITGLQDVQFFRCTDGSVNCATGSWASLGTDATSPYTATWNQGAEPEGNRSLKAIVTDNNQTTGQDVNNALIDRTAPSGGSVGYLDGYDGSGSVTVTTANGTDSGSGVNGASGLIERDSATLTGGSCGSWNNSWSTVSSPDATVASGSCYRYRYSVSDLAGNTATYSSGQVVKEDRGAPTASITDPGANLRATVTLSGSASDALSGIASVAFQRSPAGAGTWTTIGSDSSTPYSFGFDTTAVADGLYDFRTVATDLAGNTGNSTAVASRRVDNTAPATTMGNPGSPLRGTVVLGSTVSDNGSGVGTIGYEYSPAGANSWTATAASWNTTLVADGLYDLHVVATDVAGNSSTSSAVTNVRVDNTGPSVSLNDPGSPVSSSITLAVTAGDGGSGLASVVYQRSLVGQNSWTTIGTASSNPFSLGFDTTAVSDGSYDFRAVATDAAGNSTTSAIVGSRVIDNTPADVLIGSPANAAYLNSSSPDPFTITASSTDSSVTQVEFFQCSNTSAACSTGSWVSLGIDTTSPYTISWALPAADGLRALRAVTTDNANNHGSDAVAVTIDRQAPAGGSVSYADGYAGGSVTVATDTGTDSVSGVSAASAVLQRDTATLAGGSCESFSGSWSTVSSPDSTVADGHCYAYRFRVADNAGNLATYTSSNVVKVDTLSPTVAQDDPGANLRGLVTLTASAADTGGSGLASVAFQRSAAGANSWTAIGSDTTAPYSFGFDTTGVSDGLYDLRAVGTDRAGHQTVSTLIAGARVDNTAPTASLDDPVSPLRGTVTLGSQAADTGSGVASVTYQYSPAGAGTWTAIAASWNTTSVSDGLYDLRVVVADAAGNSTASAPVAGVRVDNTAPAASLDDPGSYLRGSVALSASASDGGSGLASVAFQRSAAGANSWTTIASDTSAPFAASFDTTAVSDGSFDLRVVATDAAGNQTVSASVAGRTVDNTAPTTSLDTPPGGTYLNAGAADPFGLTASTPDADVAQVEFFACDDASAGCATGNWVSVGTDTSAPFGVSWALPAVDGIKALKALATDRAGNSASSVVTVTIDRQAPNGGSVSYTNGYGSAPVTITAANGGDGVSGIDAASALLERDEATLANGACDSFTGNWTTVTSPDSSISSGHCYRYRYTIADNAGNPVTYTTGDVLKVDGGAPTVALDAGNANLRGTASLSATASDALSGVASVAFERSPAGAATWTTISIDTSAPFTASFDTTAVSDGLYDLRAVATDGGGTAATDGASRRIDNTVPSGSLTAPADGAIVYGSLPVSSNSADAGSGVGSVTFESSPAGAGTWSAIGSDTSAPYSVSFDTTPLADGEYDLRALTTDVAGNTVTSSLRTVTVDNVLIAPTLTFGSFTNAAVSGSTLYFRPGSTGGFTVSAEPNGVATADHVDFESLGSGWTGGGTDTSAPFEGSYSFDASAAEPGTGRQVVVVDDAARPSPATTFDVLADGAAPSTTVTCGGASCSSGWYSAAVSVSLAATDAGSGLAEIRYTTDGSDPTPTNGTVYTGAFAVASTTTVRYRAYDRVGNAEAVRSQLIRIDTAAPTVSLTDPGNVLSGSVTLAATAGDDGSGIASVSFQRSPAGAGTWTTIGTDTSAPYSASLDASALADGLYDLRAVATDLAGNSTISTLATSRVDATDPHVSLDDLDAAVHGIVGLSADASDTGSGISSVYFEYSPAGSDEWTTTPAAWDTTLLDEGSYDLRAGANDAAGNSAYSAVVTMLIDNTPPVALMDNPGSPLDGTVNLTSHSSDALSGIVSEVFQYSPAGTDTWTSLGGSAWDTSSVPQGRYDLRVVVRDAAGNVSASDPVLNRAVSNSGITVTILSPGNIVSGTDADPVTIQASSPDAADLLNVQFFACDNQSVNCATGNWVSLGTDTTEPYAASWTVPADGNRAIRAVATSTSHVHGADVLNTLVDRTAPSGGSVSYPDGYSTGPVTITGDPGADAGTGVDLASALIQRDEGTLAGGSCSFTGSWQTVSSPDSALASGHCYRYRYSIADLAGNARFYTSANVVKTDTGAPTVSLGDPGASLHGTVGLDATAADSESGVASLRFQRSPAGASTWTTISTDTSAPFAASFDTTSVADGLYDLRALATDAAGNQTLSTVVTDRRVDNTAPDLTFDGPAEGARVWGSLPLAANASDAATGLAWVKFRTRVGAGAWTTRATEATPPFDYSWDSTSVADGAAQIQVLASDAVGNQSSVTRSVIVDNDAPTVTLGTVPPLASGSLSLGATASADTTSVLFQSRPSGGSWADVSTDVTAPYSAVVNTTTLTDGHYDFRAVATDAAGHTASGIAANVLVDNTAPSGSITAPGSGTAVSSTVVHLAASATDAGSGVVSATFQQRTSGGTWANVAADTSAPYEADWNRTGFADGAYEVRAVLVDALGNSFATATTGITLVTGTTPPPPPTAFTFSAGKVSFVAPRGSRLVFLSLTVQLSREARVQSSLLKGKKTMRKWLNKISAGKRVLKLGIPRKLLKKGSYTLVLTATAADGSRVQRKVTVRVPAKFKTAKKR